jgi:hypothetical protein
LGTLVLLTAACDGATAPGNGRNVAIRFGSAAATSAARGDLIPSGLSADELTVTGTNATLVIQDVRFIVEELELRSSGGVASCDDDDDDECEFEGGPFIVDLPLEGDATIATENIPAGTYDSFRFKTDDLEGDDDDEDDDRARAPELLAGMRAVYPNFPSRASLVVRGTENGQAFTVYFRSKIRITQTIVPPLTIPGDDALTVKIDPSAWFKLGTQVLDLASRNGQHIELGDHFEVGIEGSHRGRH